MSFSYKIDLVKRLLHHAFAVCSKWPIFRLDLIKKGELLEKNLYSKDFIDQQIKQYLQTKLTDRKITLEPSNSTSPSYLLHYSENCSTETKQKPAKNL